MTAPGKEDKSSQDGSDAFALFDKNKNNKVKTEEIIALIQDLGGKLTCPHVQRLLSAAEQSRSGSLDMEEFLELWERFKGTEGEEESEEEILEAFNDYDTDGDGYISRQDMVQALTRMGSIRDTEEEAGKCMEEMDLDKDGKVSYAEFLLKWRIS